MLDLKAELQKILGWFDGTSVNYIEQSNSPMVHFHETTHARIFQETPDGVILRILVLLLNNKCESVPDLKELVVHLIENSRFAHEIAATYIGIKYLRTEQERVEELATLPAEYRNYYNYFSKIVDPIAGSTHLQSAIAWSATFLIFSSPLITEIAEGGLNVGPLWDVDRTPSSRARKLRRWFKKGALQSALSYAYQKYVESSTADKLSPRRLDELGAEEFWKGLTDKETVYIEGQIISQSYCWLIDNSPLESISTASSLFQESVIRFGQSLPPNNVNLVTMTKSLPSMEHGHSLEELQTQAFVQFSSVIHVEPRLNSPAREFPEIRDSTFFTRLDPETVQLCFDRDDPLGAGCYVKIYMSNPNSAEQEPTAGRLRPGLELSGIVHCSSSIAVEVLKMMAERNRTASFTVDTILAQSSALKSDILFEQISRCGSLSKIFWYQTDWNQLLLSREKLKIHLAVIRVSTDIGHMYLNIARLSDVPGTFIKALPSTAGQLIGDYYAKLFERNEMFKMEEIEDFEEITTGAADALVLALQFWTKL
jgi:hypothetical protein